MNKRGQVGIVITTAVIVVLLIAVGILGYLYFKDKTNVDCGKGALKTIDGKKVCVFLFEESFDCKNGIIKTIDGKKVCVVDTDNLSEMPVHISESCSNQNGTICNNQNCSGTLIKMVEGLCCVGSCESGTISTSQTHSICQNNQCVVVNGSGSDLCSSGEDCAVIISPVNSSANLSNVPYSFVLIDEEGPFESVQEIIDLANKYNVYLTLAFWPGEVDYILANQSRIDKVHEWQAQGHEVGIHDQGCWDGSECWNGSTLPECGFKYKYGAPAVFKPEDAEKIERLAAPYKVKSGNPGCFKWIPKTWIYEGGGRPDGRNVFALKSSDQELGHEYYTLNIKGTYAPNPPCAGVIFKIAQYKTLNGNEIMGIGFHTSDYTGGYSGQRQACLFTYNDSARTEQFGTTNCNSLPNDPELDSYVPDKSQLEDYFKLMYEKDQQGIKRMTLSDVMEKYVFPNNLTIDLSTITTDSSNQKIKECSYLEYENITGWQTTTPFNFGRCLETGTYCAFEPNGMGIHAGAPIYCPNGCIVKNISEFDISRSLAGNCGDGNCDLGENKYCPSDCSSGTKF